MINKLKGILACEAVFVFLWFLVNLSLGTEEYLSILSSAACFGLVVGVACALVEQANSAVLGALIPLAFNLIIALGLWFFGVEKDPLDYLAIVIVAALLSGIGAAAGYTYKLASSS